MTLWCDRIGVVRILVLGPVAVLGDGAEVNLGGPKPKALLVALLQQAGRVVAVERLVDLIWDESPPQSATALVHTYISLLRRGLAAAGRKDALATRSPGYLLRVEPDEVDLSGFERLLASAREAERSGDAAGAALRYGQAIDLWRGPAFGGVDAGFAADWRDALGEDRLSAEDGLARCLLDLGRTEEAAARLQRTVAAHPLREDTRALLMRALHEAGRQADALEVYRAGRRLLLDELGIEPGERLRALHAAILDGTLAAPAPTAPARSAVPRALPPDIGDFTGRADALARLLAIGGSREGDRTATPTVVVSGFGGAGKSALAVHAAHLLRPAYPDGQLFADLRGADRDLDAFEVLGRFLTALGVEELPESLDERVERYRQRVAGRRLIVLLDNARGEHQVRALLPGAPECLVLITSRSRLAGLAGTESIELDFLDQDSAVEMLGKMIGADRVAAQPDAAARIAELCGGVPLAIRAAGAKLRARPHWPLRSLAERLSDERRRLDELAVGDLAIRSSLALNYADLDAVQRRAFHLLCLLDLPDFGWWVAAPLLDVAPADAEDVVERLVDLRLLDVAGVDSVGRVRYRFHDLVQLYGAEQAAQEPPEVVAAALTRTLGTWMALVEAGSRRLPRMTLGLRPLVTAEVDVDPRLLAEAEENPVEWLKSETGAVVRAVERAHELGIDGVTTLLITSLLSSPFAVRNEFDGWQRTHEVALAAARAGGDRRAEAMVLAGLGQLHYEKDDFAAAEAHFRMAHEQAVAVADDPIRAIALIGLGTVARDVGEFARAAADLTAAAAIGDDCVVAAARYGLGAIERDHGDMAAAFAHFAASIERYRSLADRRGEALALRGLSLCHRALDEYEPAARLSADAASILLASGDDLGATYAHQSWAKASLRLGVVDGVAEALAGCLEVCTRRRDRFGAALMTRTLGEYHLATGDQGFARELLAEALDRWSELDLALWQARTLRDLAAADPDNADKHWLRATELFTAVPTRELAELSASSPAEWLARVQAPYRL
ncbi:SARP family transcriptional regulator [Actinokineospora fastidiosa]|uniref:SARP family transcriptional regulator n=1 Tax=Actinokineospora fastidiosa TaxID=1816 RepID=A0A918L7H3_9PSEU|nr:SARP family transcriptional regulator [Actinokineospora fastidiosa]